MVTFHEENAGVRAALADGQVGLLRPLGPDDRDAVLGLHESLDEHDRYFRFFGPLPPRLNDLVFGMTAPVDVRHGSMGAFLDEELVGVAHYEVLADATKAEVRCRARRRPMAWARCWWTTWHPWPVDTGCAA